MSGSGRTIYVAGAGIAGLALALALAKFGATVIVLERKPAIQEIGAGLQISPNARKVLAQLGLDRQVAQKSFEPLAIDVHPFRSTRPLVSLVLGGEIADRFEAPYAVMHRADLAAMLFRACKRFANIDIRFGTRAFDAVSHGRGVSLVIDDADGEGRSARAFALVGADGVNSHTRTKVLHGPEATYSGYVAWRSTLAANALDGVLAPERTTLLLAPGYHAICYPLPYRKQINIALFAKEKEAVAFGSKPPTAPNLPWAVLKSPTYDALMAATEGAWGFWPVSTVVAPRWHEGSIGLIGDAAHAMLPFQAQGAAMALEDAAILAPLLMTEPDAESAFRRFTALRRPRVERVRKVSKSNGFAFHLEWPFTLGRDAVLKLGGRKNHLKRLAWLYGYNAAPDPAIGAPLRDEKQDHSH